MKSAIVLLCVFFLNPAHAQLSESLTEAYGLHSVVVPTVWGTPSGSDLVQGMLYFDGSTRTLKFVGDSATPISIASAETASVESSGSAERIERAFIVNSGTCSVGNSSGNWITGIGTPASGDCSLSIQGFSAAPTCVVTQTQDSGSAFCRIQSSSTTSVVTNCVNSAMSSSPRNHMIICMGPR